MTPKAWAILVAFVALLCGAFAGFVALIVSMF